MRNRWGQVPHKMGMLKKKILLCDTRMVFVLSFHFLVQHANKISHFKHFETGCFYNEHETANIFNQIDSTVIVLFNMNYILGKNIS